jgi:hypothetical protein
VAVAVSIFTAIYHTWRNVVSKLKIPATVLVIGTMSLGGPAIAASITSLSAAAKPMA